MAFIRIIFLILNFHYLCAIDNDFFNYFGGCRVEHCLPSNGKLSENQETSYKKFEIAPGGYTAIVCQAFKALPCCKPKFEILHNGIAVNISDKLKYHISNKEHGYIMVHLRNYTIEDSGNYTCKVTYEGSTSLTQEYNILTLVSKESSEFSKDVVPFDKFENKLYWLPDEVTTNYKAYSNQIVELKVKYFVPLALKDKVRVDWMPRIGESTIRHLECEEYLPLFRKFFNSNDDKCYQFELELKFKYAGQYKIIITAGNSTLVRKFHIGNSFVEETMIKESIYKQKQSPKNSENKTSDPLAFNKNDDVEKLEEVDDIIHYSTIEFTSSSSVCKGGKFVYKCSASPYSSRILLKIVKLVNDSEILIAESPKILVKSRNGSSSNTTTYIRIAGSIVHTVDKLESEMAGIYLCKMMNFPSKGKTMRLSVINCDNAGNFTVVSGDRNPVVKIVLSVVIGVLAFIILVGILIFKLCCSKRLQKLPIFCQLTEIELIDTESNSDSDVRIPLIRPRIVRTGFTRRILYQIPCESRWEINRSTVILHELLGEGNFGEVHRGQLDNEAVAVKKLKEPYSQEEVISLLKEAEIMKRLGRHDNIISFVGLCPVHEDDVSPWLVMELASNGNLRDFLRERDPGSSRGCQSEIICPEVTITDMRKFALQIASGMEYITSKKVIHRDLAARNVLLTRTLCCKIADFGLTREAQEYYRFNQGPLPIRWLAPEAINCGIVTHKSDVWSYGICLWEIFSFGASPFPNLEANAVAHNISRGFLNRKPSSASTYDFEIMTQCWEQNPDNRPNFSDLVKKLEDNLRRPSDVTSGVSSLGSDEETISYLDFGSYRTASMRHSSETSSDSGRTDASHESAISFINPSYVVAIAPNPDDRVDDSSPGSQPYYNMSSSESYYNVIPSYIRSVSQSSNSPDSVFERLNPIPENDEILTCESVSLRIEEDTQTDSGAVIYADMRPANINSFINI